MQFFYFFKKLRFIIIIQVTRCIRDCILFHKTSIRDYWSPKQNLIWFIYLFKNVKLQHRHTK